MSFGGGSRSKTSRKRKRSLEEVAEQVQEEEKVDDFVGGEDEIAVESEKGGGEVREGDAAVDNEGELVVKEEGPEKETTIVDKVRVVYDSDGEVAERVVEKIEVVTKVNPAVQSVCEITHKNSVGGKKKNKYPGRYAAK